MELGVSSARSSTPPPEARRPLGDSTNTPPRRASVDGMEQVMPSPERVKGSPEKFPIGKENTPPRKISVLENNSSPGRGVVDLGEQSSPVKMAELFSSALGKRDASVTAGSESDAVESSQSKLARTERDSSSCDLKIDCADMEIVSKNSIDLSAEEKPAALPRFGKGKALCVTSETDVSAFFQAAQKSFVSEESLLRWSIESIPSETNVFAFLSEKGIEIDRSNLIGTGSFGAVYKVVLNQNLSSDFNGTEIVYKREKELKLLADDKSLKLGRDRDVSSSRLDLPHLVKPLVFLLQVELEGRGLQKFYVPANKIKEFRELLPAGARVSMEGQLMELAPGKSLAEHVKKDKNFFHPSGPHFANVIRAVDEFLRAAYADNFIHRDLKLENILYDPETGNVTIIDSGESSRLRSRGKTDEQTKMSKVRPSNPTASTEKRGSRFFKAPAIVEAKEYGSEVDFFSAGMVLLNLISPNDFEKFRGERLTSVFDDLLSDQDPRRYLEIYLNQIGPESETSKILREQPHLKSLIDLYFQTSSVGSPKAAEQSARALAASRNLMDTHFSSMPKSPMSVGETSYESLDGSSPTSSLALGSSFGGSSPDVFSSKIDDL